MSTYYSKYLKYKNKYINLKNILGGSDRASDTGETYSSQIMFLKPNIATTLQPLFISLNNNNKNVYNSTEIRQEIQLAAVQMLNGNEDIPFYNTIENTFNIYQKNIIKEFKDTSLSSHDTLISNYFDLLGAIYACTNEFKSYWDSIANETKVNIKIFIGENEGFRNFETEIITESIVGVNILLGCMTEAKSQEFNRSENNNGKLFIGFNSYVHLYGNDIYNCPNPLDKIFIDTKLIDTNQIKILQIIDYFYLNLKNNRNCGVINKNKIIEKIEKIKRKSNLYNNQQYYIRSKEQDNCKSKMEHCVKNQYFSDYFYNLVTPKKEDPNILEQLQKKFEEKLKLVESKRVHEEKIHAEEKKIRDEKEKTRIEDEKKELEAINRLKENTEHNTNITSNVNNYFVKNVFENLILDETNIFIIKNNNKIYFKIVDNDNYIYYINEDGYQVDENGDQYDDFDYSTNY